MLIKINKKIVSLILFSKKKEKGKKCYFVFIFVYFKI